MRILGLDYGAKTVGVAVSDALGLTAQGIETIVRRDENKLRKTCARIEELIKEYGVSTIVLGYPKHMNNTLGERAEKTEEFQAMLVRRTGLPVVLWDERLSFILQNYLDYMGTAKKAAGELNVQGLHENLEKSGHETDAGE